MAGEESGPLVWARPSVHSPRQSLSLFLKNRHSSADKGICPAGRGKTIPKDQKNKTVRSVLGPGGVRQLTPQLHLQGTGMTWGLHSTDKTADLAHIPVPGSGVTAPLSTGLSHIATYSPSGGHLLNGAASQ